MASKTRDRLIEVARQLFARKGVENTTMLDIANASDKGRRTLYTYFRNKREIHQAVIEQESEQLVSAERRIQRMPVTASEKLGLFIDARIDAAMRARPRTIDQKYLRSLLEFPRAGKMRRLASVKEMEIFRNILNEGIAAGEFSEDALEKMPPVMVLLVLGLLNPQMNEYFDLFELPAGQLPAQLKQFVLDVIRPASANPISEINQ